MKKRLISLILVCALALSFVTSVWALDVAQQIEQQTGINPEKIQDLPKSPEEIKETYLKQQWSELVAKNKFLSPIHSFLTKISPVFLVLFGENYSLSPTLLGVIAVWFFVSIELSILLVGLVTLNSWACRGIGVGISVLIAQIGAYRTLITALSNLIYSQELWWMRLLIIMALIVSGFIIDKMMKVAEKQIQLSKKNAKDKALENEIEKQKEFIKGMKEGNSLYN